MNKYESSEIRWFYHGKLPGSIEDWFQSISPQHIQNQSQRTDFYLKPTLNASTGIKLREGRFEVKVKNRDKEKWSFQKLSGTMETWTKWSGKMAEANIPHQIIDDKNNWLKVVKERSLYVLEITGAKASFSAYGADIRNGCLAELTRVVIDDQLCWTFGLEAFGEANEMEMNLNQALKRVFLKKCPLEFVIENSFSYPEWLEKF